MPELPVTARGTVYPWQCDHMDHVNVAHYVAKFDEATWQLFALIGMPPSYLRQKRYGMAAVQQNISYKRELRAGDIITIRSELLEVREKAIRFLHEMRNDETGDVAAVAELTAVHMDLAHRKSCPIPAEIAARARALMAEMGIAPNVASHSG